MRKDVVSFFACLLLIPILMVQLGFSEEMPNQSKNQFPLEFSFLNHASSMPFNSTILKILHPGFSLGTEYIYKDGRSGDIFQNLKVQPLRSNLRKVGRIGEKTPGFALVYGYFLDAFQTINMHSHCSC